MIREGTEVKWEWSGSTATGKVVEVIRRDTTKTISGSEVHRDASDDEPAYLIKQEDGQNVLKSCTEVERADS